MTRNSIAAPDLRGAAWKKSSYSGNNQSQCVEVADVIATFGGVGVRDSKNPDGPALLFPQQAFADFLAEVAAGRFDV
ncbi:DUF397 domain-containing protein [Actinacidiphila sp. DG2A-62]|uniref:DUF397 domain-containing protein n=1 Tax=Actinacidiphila sp. DG2A-62 TaxID=3108821 RepID=UPI002DBB4D05|nr:DUF397 domain-containing protein [Actinacidiphila sp. DG2A-62]MEC3995138.1 DUF397 domain-containing protein [Actinacidiphila sp. DG2A-62]